MKFFLKQKNTRLIFTLVSKKRKKLAYGFTLIETLVAVSIFTVSILALIIILSQGLTNTSYIKQKMTAGYLAQEGIEYIRNMRDTYVLYSTPAQVGWDAFYTNLTNASALCQNANGCYFNADNVFSFPSMPMTHVTPVACGTSCLTMLYDTNTGKYNYTTGISSGYIRKITITPIGSPVNEIKVSSTVYWTQGSGQKSISLTEDLFNWVE